MCYEVRITSGDHVLYSGKFVTMKHFENAGGKYSVSDWFVDSALGTPKNLKNDPSLVVDLAGNFLPGILRGLAMNSTLKIQKNILDEERLMTSISS